MSSNEISHDLALMFTMHDPNTTEGREALVQLMREREEAAYVRGAEMARRLMRLQLGLGTPQDHAA